MRLVWHIIRKDLRRLRLPLALWGAVIFAHYVVWRLDQVDAMDGRLGGTAASAVVLFWALHLVIAWVLVPLIVLDDSLHDDRAAWRTRPISARRLLAAKLGGVALMLWFWPSLLTVPWWIELEFGAGEIVRLVLVNMAGMAAFTGVALLIAVLVENFARFILWSIVAVVAGALGGLTIAVGMTGDGDGPVNGAVLITRAGLACGTIWAAALVVVPLQYLRRSLRLARGLAVAAALAAMLIAQAWPWSAAQMQAGLGGKRLPKLTAQVTSSTVVMPAEPAKQRALVRVGTEFAATELATSDAPWIKSTFPFWQIGEQRGRGEQVGMGFTLQLWPAAADLGNGRSGTRAERQRLDWEIALPGASATAVRTGGAVIRAEHHGAIWRGTAALSAPVRPGAWAAAGLRHLHISAIDTANYAAWNSAYDREHRSIRWAETEPLIQPAVMLELLNPDGMAGRRFATARLRKGGRESFDRSPTGWRGAAPRYLAHGRIPVGVMSVSRMISAFDPSYDMTGNQTPDPLVTDGATLTTVVFLEAAPAKVTLAATPLVPDLVIEARLEDALRRAKEEEKLVFVRVVSANGDATEARDPESWQYTTEVRELMATRFVCAQLSGAEAAALRKRTDDPSSAIVVILKPNGEEQDRLWDLYWAAMRDSLEANLAGKTYAALLKEKLAAGTGNARQLRYQLHEALRARGELTGAFDAILWLAEHSAAPFEGTEVFSIGWRLERLVNNFGAARTALLERRELAVANLRRDPRDAGAARLLFTISLAFRREEAIWREFPRIMPRENSFWWELTRNWIGESVSNRHYLETAKAVDLEKFFAEGPAWVRAQLLQKRPLVPNGPPATVADWQRQLVRAGVHCAEALAGAKNPEAALRVAQAVRRIDGSSTTRSLLAEALTRGGAMEEAKRLLNDRNL